MSTELKDRIAKTRGEISALTETLHALIRTCTHSQRKPADFGFESETCDVCEKHLGWTCPESPDRVCHYYSDDDGTVKLTSGQSVPVPEGHNAEFETHDSCIFCHNPEERK